MTDPTFVERVETVDCVSVVLDMLEKDISVDKIVFRILKILNDPEKVLNVMILDVLHDILTYKLNTRKVDKAKNAIEFDYSGVLTVCLQVLKQEHETGCQWVSKLCKIVDKSLLLLNDDMLCSSTLDIIMTCEAGLLIFTESDILQDKLKVTFKPEISVRLIDTVLNVLLIKQKHVSCGFEKIHEKIVNLDDLIIQLSVCTVSCISTEVILYIIPKYVIYCTRKNFLEKLWKHLEKDLQKNASEYSHVFYILCSLADFYFSAESGKFHSFSITTNNAFWELLQSGLIESNPLIRKQALYLMKRVVHICSSNGKYVSEPLMWWDKTTSDKIWDNFFLIIETMEEKQVHIIKPVLPVVDYLVESCITPSPEGQKLHETWLICVYHRIITHDSTAVIKWGLISFIETYKKLKFSKHCILSFMGMFMNAINDTSLYLKNSPEISVSDMGKVLEDLFVFVAESCCSDYSQAFFDCVLDKMSEIPWAPVPLFNISYAMGSIKHCPVWDGHKLKLVKSFMTEALRCQYVFIRGAVQCMFLDATIHLTRCDQIDICTIADLLGSFREAESLTRGTTSWNNAAEWIKNIIDKKEAFKFMKTLLSLEGRDCGDKIELSTKSTARMIVLLFDAGILLPDAKNECSVTELLYLVFSPLRNCVNRLYANEASQIRSLQTIIVLLNESRMVGNKLTIEDKFRTILFNSINSRLSEVFEWFSRKMLNVAHLQDYYLINTCLDAVNTFSAEFSHLPHLEKNIIKLHETAVKVVMASDAPPVCRYFSMKTLAIISQCMRRHCKCTCKQDPCAILERYKSVIDHIVVNGRLNKPLVKEEAELKLTRDLQTLWGKLSSEYLEAGWSIVDSFVHACHFGVDNILQLRSFKSLIDDALTSLEIGGWNLLVPMMKVVGKILPKCSTAEDEKVTLKLISTCWEVIFELRKTELFWTSMKAFIEMLFQPYTLIAGDFQECLKKYSEKIFLQGQAITGLTNLLVTRLQALVTGSSVQVLELALHILVNALIFGPVHRKDQRIITDTCLFIASLGDKCSVNSLVPSDCYADSEVRMRALQMMLHLCTERKNQNFASQLVEALIEKDKSESSSKSRYYNDSHLHRIKHRILQNLLILEPLLGSKEAKRLLTWLQDSLLKESQQPSVRYQQEWLIVRIVLHHPHLKECLWTKFQEAQQRRPGSVCSFIAVMYHLANTLQHEKDIFVEKCINMMLPLCMAQHFSIRLYAQTTVQKLLQLCKQHDYLNQVTEKYAVIEGCLKTCMEQGNSVKNSQKLQEDFYFNCFHPVNHYSFETIFYDLPRLANITQDEWIPLNVVRNCGVVETDLISMNNTDTSLKQFRIAAWVLKSSGLAEEEEDENAVGSQSNFQKKLVPWRSLIPDHELRPSTAEPVVKKEGLIVVASLIDRLPNLGGLSRTCEVFGVSEYVIGNLRYIEDKQFQNLSVTAEQWIPISEVKPHVLPKYLESRKKEGYTLIGAEQTANSIRLGDVKFPKKTLLLLGNEKEGIPANLLPILDECVEIPQHGVVRSLNVHVTGALFVWEYIRQHTPT